MIGAVRNKTRGVAGALLSVTALVSGCGSAPVHTASSTDALDSLGRVVRDGDFAFTLTRFDSHLPKIRDHIAQGEYVAVIMTVKNVGNRPEPYVGANQKLKDIAGKTYPTDNAVDATLNDGQISPAINPGHQVQWASVFDVPPDTVPAAIEVYESASSAGASINLPLAHSDAVREDEAPNP